MHDGGMAGVVNNEHSRALWRGSQSQDKALDSLLGSDVFSCFCPFSPLCSRVGPAGTQSHQPLESSSDGKVVSFFQRQWCHLRLDGILLVKLHASLCILVIKAIVRCEPLLFRNLSRQKSPEAMIIPHCLKCCTTIPHTLDLQFSSLMQIG